MTQPTAEQLEVTQADRDAAAASYAGFLAAIRGDEDGTSLAQAFARHRQATEARMSSAERERCARIVEDWPDNGISKQALWRVAAVIRSQNNA